MGMIILYEKLTKKKKKLYNLNKILTIWIEMFIQYSLLKNSYLVLSAMMLLKQFKQSNSP